MVGIEILVSFVTEIGECLLVPIKHHVSYLICYGQHVDTLRTKLNKLEQRLTKVQQDVVEAHRRGHIIHDEVQKWLEHANNIKSKVERQVDGLMNTKCLKGYCWNPAMCYRLGKKAAKTTVTIGQLENEGKFECVARPPPPPRTESLFPNIDFQTFASTEALMQLVFNALKTDGINIIGVHGMGGVGKTTLMKEVAKKAEQEELFDKAVIVTVSQNPSIKKIQEDIGEFLGFKFEEENESVRAAKMSARLKKVKKLLMILDDLWEKLEFSDVGIPYGDQHKGCKIVVVSRSSDICMMMKSQRNIEVYPLLNEESWTLFKANAGDVVDSNELSKVARKVVKECKGLPLAIRVLGLALRNKNDFRVWNAVLRMLKNSIPTGIQGMEKEVFQSIIYSFDHLDSEEAKQCFLFCCLFPEDEVIWQKKITGYMVGEGLMKLTKTLDEAEEEVALHMDNLMACGLLLKRVGKTVKMHDIVRDVTIWIASQETYLFYTRPRARLKEWPRNMRTEECRRLSLMYNDIAVLPEEPLSFPNLHTLLLGNNQRLERIPDNFFLEMKSLRVVDVTMTRISSLPTSLTSLMNLRLLDLSFCHQLMNLSGIGALRNLEVLDLRANSSLDVIPTELGKLSFLRYLNLDHTPCRIPSNVICRLSRLEKLYVFFGFQEWQPQESEDTSRAAFAELACLPCLTTLFVTVKNESCFWQDLDEGAFQQLRRFHIGWPSGIFLNSEQAWLPIGVLPKWVAMIAERASVQKIIHSFPSRLLWYLRYIGVEETLWSGMIA